MALYAKALDRARRQRDLAIRPITPADNPDMARIIREVMGEFGAVGEGYSINDPEVNDMAGSYAGERAAFLVVVRGPKVLGGAGVAQLEGADPETCELRKMYVLPELRGLGMGRRLLERCLTIAAELGYRRCYLETLSHMAQAQALYEANGFGDLPICMAKTHLSISHDPNLKNAPSGYTLSVREARASVGAGFIYPLIGAMRTMPGLGSKPAFMNVDVDEDGRVIGLF